MPDFAVSASPGADWTASLPLAETLHTLVSLSLTGIIVFRPVYAAGEETIIDLAYEHLNPAAQRMLGLPERPTATFLTLYPHAAETGIFAFYRDSFLSGEPSLYQVNYQHDQLNNYFHLAAQRSGPVLLVSFDDTAAQPRTAVEDALRESQAREQQARTEAEARRRQLEELFEQAPVALGYFEGPELVIAAANPPICALWGRSPAEVVGRPLLAAVPELRGQGFDTLLLEVLRTGVPFVGTEVPATMLREGELQTTYYNFVYQPLRDEQGTITGVVDVALEVTELVRARQQAEANAGHTEQLNRELAAANAELHAATAAAEQARREAEAQRQALHALFMQAPAGIATLSGPELTFTLANPPYHQLVGNRPVLGKTHAEALPELEGQPFPELLRQVYRTGETYSGNEQLVYLDLNGTGRLEAVYFNFIYQATRDAAGQIDGIQLFAYDVSAQVLARQHIEASEQELAAANEELQAANEELQAINEELFHTEQQLRELNQDLEQRVLERTAAQQAAQHEAERQRARLESLFMQAPAPIVIFDGPRLVFQLVNPAYQLIFPGRVLLGQPLLAALPELAGTEILDILNQVYRTGEPYVAQGLPQRLARHEGGPLEEIYLTFTYQARRNGAGDVDGVLTFAYEVTDQVRARQQVQGLNQRLLAANAELETIVGQLTRTNRDLDNFVYAASHDLKQPVNNLAGLFEEVRRAATFPDPAEEGLLVPMIAEGLQQLSTTIDDLAAIGYAQQVSADAPAEAVDLDELVQEVLQTLEPQVRAARARVSTDFAVRPTLSYPRANLRTILLNLLGNALKYADPARPARIHVSLWLDGGQPVLRVEDNGLGFDAERHRGELFQLFRRFHDHTAGTGVGLYLVNRIIQAHGGSMDVESEIGQGTTFRLRLGPQGAAERAAGG